MSKKKTNTTSGDLTTIRIGSRVRHIDDGVEGRITWANGTSVKIEWTDGEKVTWKRADLASKGLEVLDADGQSTTTPADRPAVPETPPVEPTTPEAAPVEQVQATEQPPAEKPLEEQPDHIGFDQVGNEYKPEAAEPAAPKQPAVAEPTASEPGTPTAKPKRQRKAPAEPKDKKLSALDAAAKVLAEAGTPMTCPEMIEAMAAKKYWTSPGGQTPSATLYSAILREINTKGADARFTKIERGKFGRKG